MYNIIKETCSQIWNCNFDTNTILTQQCGGATGGTGPSLSGPTWGIVANDVIAGITPALAVTDIKSISMLYNILIIIVNLYL